MFLNIENKKSPSSYYKNKEIGKLGKWISDQKNQYFMKNENVKNLWLNFIQEYKQYFMNYEELWNNNLKNVKDYIDKNKKLPLRSDKNIDYKKLGSWLSNQEMRYKKNKKMINNENIKNIWLNFLEEYKKYFMNNEEIWNNNLKETKDYIDKNDKKPSTSDKNKDINRLAGWLSHQQYNYKNNQSIMKDENIKNLWLDFLEKYNKYFMNNK